MNDDQTQDNHAITDDDALSDDTMADDSMDALPDGDRQLVTDSDAIDQSSGGGNNDSDLGADVAGDIGPKHD